MARLSAKPYCEQCVLNARSRSSCGDRSRVLSGRSCMCGNEGACEADQARVYLPISSYLLGDSEFEVEC